MDAQQQILRSSTQSSISFKLQLNSRLHSHIQHKLASIASLESWCDSRDKSSVVPLLLADFLQREEDEAVSLLSAVTQAGSDWTLWSCEASHLDGSRCDPALSLSQDSAVFNSKKSFSWFKQRCLFSYSCSCLTDFCSQWKLWRNKWTDVEFFNANRATFLLS